MSIEFGKMYVHRQTGWFYFLTDDRKLLARLIKQGWIAVRHRIKKGAFVCYTKSEQESQKVTAELKLEIVELTSQEGVEA